MTTTEAADFLFAFYRERVAHGKQREWTDTATGQKRPPEAAPITDAELAQLRAAYALLPAAERRSAWHGYKRNGVTIGDVPGATRARFALGDDQPWIVVNGFDTGETWNGWRVPLLTAEEAKRVCEALTRSFAEAGDARAWTFDAERAVIVEEETDPVTGEVERYEHEAECTPLAVPLWSPEDDDHLSGIPLYNCGFGMCWTLHRGVSEIVHDAAIRLIAEVQAAGGVCAYVDLGHTFDATAAVEAGIRLDDLLVSQTNDADQAAEIVDTLVRTGAIALVVCNGRINVTLTTTTATAVVLTATEI